jgi:hypothetical protein
MRYEEFLVLTPQASAFVCGSQALADGTVWGSSSRLLVEFLLERYELYAQMDRLPPKAPSKIYLNCENKFVVLLRFLISKNIWEFG